MRINQQIKKIVFLYKIIEKTIFFYKKKKFSFETQIYRKVLKKLCSLVKSCFKKQQNFI